MRSSHRVVTSGAELHAPGPHFIDALFFAMCMKTLSCLVCGRNVEMRASVTSTRSLKSAAATSMFKLLPRCTQLHNYACVGFAAMTVPNVSMLKAPDSAR